MHSDPKNNAVNFKIDQLIIKVYKQDMAMGTAVANVNNIPVEDGTISTKIVATYLLKKMNDSWLVTHGHISKIE
ncbi:hypothetical protein ACFLU5_02795 [Bacteroidota bacterium]